MRAALLQRLACPQCRGSLETTRAVPGAGGAVASDVLACQGCPARYPVKDGVPRFVPAENYAGNFGLQWNRFRRTQLDSHSGVAISRERFFRQTGWAPEALRGKSVLDIGCGAGRFAEVALLCGAEVVAVDYSSAVDACWANLSHHPGFHAVQADVYHLPFRPSMFDFVYCFGVLQHTPDVRGAFMALPAQLAAGGRLAVDVYPHLPANRFWPKYWLRPLTRRLPADRMLGFVERFVAVLWPLTLTVGRIPVLGRKLRYAIPVANYDGVYPLSRQQLREWAVLDTYDMLLPAHDYPQSAATVSRWFADAGLADIEVFRSGFLIGRGRKS
jgi:SAM-dependent methyltransferase